MIKNCNDLKKLNKTTMANTKIEFLSNKEKYISIDKNRLEKLKQVSKKDIDLECYNIILNEIINSKFDFIIDPHEYNCLENIEDKNKLDYLIYRFKFKEYPKRKINTSFPIHVLIEPASTCNLRCPMCFQSDKSFTKKEFMGKMDYSFYEKIIDECVINKAKAITFGSRGEPTMHPKIKQIIEYAAGKFIDIKLITNGTKMSDDLIHSIMKSNINLLQFSIDSEEKETYERLRKFAKYDEVLANVQRVQKIRKLYKNNKMFIRVSGVKVEEQQNEKSFCNFWEQYADEVVFKKYFERWDTYNNIPTKNLDTPCEYIWEKLYIWYDGKVNPCDADYKSYLSYGNVKSNSIKDLWNSKSRMSLIEKHLSKNRNKITPCDRCGIS